MKKQEEPLLDLDLDKLGNKIGNLFTKRKRGYGLKPTNKVEINQYSITYEELEKTFGLEGEIDNIRIIRDTLEIRTKK